MAVFVSPLAAVDPRAELADDVFVGPFCTIGPLVRIGTGTRLENSVTLMGRVTLGCDNVVYPGAVIGGEPQDLSYRRGDTQVVVGDGNVIREGVTINRGTEKENGLTVVGSQNFLMAGCHVAHDCRLGNRIVIANNTLLGGHVHVHDHATLSGGIGVNHFATIGAFSFTAGLSRVLHDVPPFMLVEGDPARPRCVNTVALKRNGFPLDAITALTEAHRLLYRIRVGLEQAHGALEQAGRMTAEVQQLFDFIREQQDGRHGRSREKLRRAA
jgi:UDP-N-acetylglucosamine acyltransferase